MFKGISRSHRAHTLIEAIGWYGVVAIVLAYLLLSLGQVEPSGSLYLWLNLTGAAAIIVHSLLKKDYQPLVLNLVWLVIALIALTRVA